MALFLSETTPIALAGLMLVLPIVLVMYIPIFLLSRISSSDTSKIIALFLALLLILLEHCFNTENLGSVYFGFAVAAFFYLPLAVVIYKIIKSAS